MSAQLSAPDRAGFASGDMYQGTPDDYVAARISYLAYSGRYYVDEARGTVEHCSLEAPGEQAGPVGGDVPWRFSEAGLRACGWPRHCPRPKTSTGADGGT